MREARLVHEASDPADKLKGDKISIIIYYIKGTLYVFIYFKKIANRFEKKIANNELVGRVIIDADDEVKNYIFIAGQNLFQDFCQKLKNPEIKNKFHRNAIGWAESVKEQILPYKKWINTNRILDTVAYASLKYLSNVSPDLRQPGFVGKLKIDKEFSGNMTIKDDNADTMLYITDGCFKFKIMITSIDENNSR
jgi:MFS superfamily sulfate permease-like transporter